jgi:hypothetical protein
MYFSCFPVNPGTYFLTKIRLSMRVFKNQKRELMSCERPEISEKNRGILLSLAAKRGLRGYRRIVEETLEYCIEQGLKNAPERVDVLKMEGSWRVADTPIAAIPIHRREKRKTATPLTTPIPPRFFFSPSGLSQSARNFLDLSPVLSNPAPVIPRLRQ